MWGEVCASSGAMQMGSTDGPRWCISGTYVTVPHPCVVPWHTFKFQVCGRERRPFWSAATLVDRFLGTHEGLPSTTKRRAMTSSQARCLRFFGGSGQTQLFSVECQSAGLLSDSAAIATVVFR